MEKIHEPGQGVTVFTVYGGGLGRADGGPAKRYLVLRADRKAPLLFLSAHRVPVNAQPPASVMRLRKYLSERRIARASCHWTERRLYLETSGGSTLLLDLREGPTLLFGPTPAFEEPAWPDPEVSPSALCSGDGWRAWPVLTPALRRTLPYLDPEDGRALLMDLQAGGGDVFMYETETGEREVSAWPLPRAQWLRMKPVRGEARESVWEDPVAALALAGESRVYAAVAAGARQMAARPFAAEVKRLDKLLDKLDREEVRLASLRDRQADALLLQGQLYRFGPEEKRASVTLDGPGGPRELALEPRLTVRENMAALFHQAARGRRGLEHLVERRAAVRAEKNAAVAAMLQREAALSGTGDTGSAYTGHAGRGAARPERAARPGAGRPSGLPKQVQAFRSGDGFLLLRGRDTRGNALALKLAAPHDYWLHTADGPSAHVIIRRDHAGQEVPERTLAEAGALAALKSRLRDEARAEIQYSLAKYIHPMKKAAPGMVRIDKSEGTFWVSPDRDLEEKLRMPE